MSINDLKVRNKIDFLLSDAKINDPLVRQKLREQNIQPKNEMEFFKAMNKAYLPVNLEFGNLLYILGRSSKAKTIVEFGTSFGVSTLFLASAIKDNGAGKVITTEFDEAKAQRAYENLKDAGLNGFVEIRIGDALETLKRPFENKIDLLFLDGAKSMYLDVLKLVESDLSSGAIIASDNTDQEELKPFINYLRSSENGYLSSPILTHMMKKGHEISIKI
jgi:predicted O-methyltransferase YrrM